MHLTQNRVVLSQCFGERPKLHPVTFFSWKLSPDEQNYDVGNWELLAVKLEMDEWQHWLEGATHPFVVLTDYKNLEYLRMAECLKPCQACWSLFFTRLQFIYLVILPWLQEHKGSLLVPNPYQSELWSLSWTHADSLLFYLRLHVRDWSGNP